MYSYRKPATIVEYIPGMIAEWKKSSSIVNSLLSLLTLLLLWLATTTLGVESPSWCYISRSVSD